MKRFLTVLLTALAMTGALCVGASASSFDGAAEELAAIGVLKGSAGDFHLDQAPTRAQAAILLTRLLGAEEEAQAAYASGKLRCPFDDVTGSAAPCVAWLTDKGIAGGVSETAFGPSKPCTAKAYTIFLLRALGYEDGVDFTAANAQEFAQSLGLLDTSLFTGSFLRDDLVSVTYQALGTDLKDGSAYWLESLVRSGAVDASAARPITDKIEAYRTLQDAGAAMAQGLDAGMEVKLGMTAGLKGVSGGTPMDVSQREEITVKGSMKTLSGQSPQMAMDLTLITSDATGSQSQRVEYWLKDGVTYVRSGKEAYQLPSGEDMESIQALMGQPAGQAGAALLPFIDRVSAASSGGNTVYTLTLNGAFGKVCDGLFGAVLDTLPSGLDMDANLSMDGGVITYTVDRSGTLKSAALNTAVKASMDASDGRDAVALEFTAAMDMTTDIRAMGKAVKIQFPDLSGFTKIIGGADGSTAIMGAAASA